MDIKQLKEDEKEESVVTRDELLKAKVALRLSMTGLFCIIVSLILLFVPMDSSWFIAISFGLFYAVLRSSINIVNMIRKIES